MPDTEVWTPEDYHRHFGQSGATGAARSAPKKDRYKSDAERNYAVLCETWRQAGVIVRWYYEPCKGLYLAPALSYTPDFLLEYPERPRLEMHEVQGKYKRTKDWNRAKQAASLYPCWRFVRAKWDAGRWTWDEIPAV